MLSDQKKSKFKNSKRNNPNLCQNINCFVKIFKLFLKLFISVSRGLRSPVLERLLVLDLITHWRYVPPLGIVRSFDLNSPK